METDGKNRGRATSSALSPTSHALKLYRSVLKKKKKQAKVKEGIATELQNGREHLQIPAAPSWLQLPGECQAFSAFLVQFQPAYEEDEEEEEEDGATTQAMFSSCSENARPIRETSGPNFRADHSRGVNISPLYVEPPVTDPTPSRFSSSRFAAHAGNSGDKYPQQNSFPQQPKVRQSP
ncbi:hypothetical protein Q7C36_013208 [Tachysurus vachellii]|uniref:Uncharacterized protein n=1 Tax=Tachysurus vachellii TaxID=175792 RepID=A0AA88SGK1_TACVA|nr:hypothetical protein Q7C36_013208 [Tachysurus vachellii]